LSRSIVEAGLFDGKTSMLKLIETADELNRLTGGKTELVSGKTIPGDFLDYFKRMGLIYPKGIRSGSLSYKINLPFLKELSSQLEEYRERLKAPRR